MSKQNWESHGSEGLETGSGEHGGIRAVELPFAGAVSKAKEPETLEIVDADLAAGYVDPQFTAHAANRTTDTPHHVLLRKTSVVEGNEGPRAPGTEMDYTMTNE